MWNLILRTLRKKPDVRAVHMAENSRTFLVTVTPPNTRRAPLDHNEILSAIEDYCMAWESGYAVEVQVIA